MIWLLGRHYELKNDTNQKTRLGLEPRVRSKKIIHANSTSNMTSTLTADYIFNIEKEITNTIVKVELQVSDSEDNDYCVPIRINHDDLRTWLEENGRLETVSNTSDTVTGEHVQTVYEVGYLDYIRYEMPDAELYGYLKQSKLTTLQYTPE